MERNDNKTNLADAASNQLDGMTKPSPHGATGFTAYIFMQVAWFVIFGVQIVLFPYLVRVVLEESEVRLGIAQACIQLPTTLLILFGGFVADRHGGRRLLITIYIIAVVPFFLLATAVASGFISYGLMIVYAISVGTVGAFGLPARDALLSQVAPTPSGDGLQKAVSFALLGQFGGQILGMLLAASAMIVGVPPVLFMQAALLAMAAYAGRFLNPRPLEHKTIRGDIGPVSFMFAEISGGIRAAMKCDGLAPTIALSFAIGICFLGTLLVLLPLMVQNYFLDAQNPLIIAGALGVFSMCFWVGTMVSAVALIRLGTPRRKGLTYICALAVGAVILFAMSQRMPFWLLCFCNFLWGLGGGVGMTAGRGIIQEAAPPAVRARILSLFSLGFLGGAPIGSFAFGFFAGHWGPYASTYVPGCLMLLSIAAVTFFSKLPTYVTKTDAQSAGNAPQRPYFD